MKVNTDGVLLGAAMSLVPSSLRLLDIGTGTGTIALMAAQRHPSALIDALEIDGPSAVEAEANFKASPWADRLKVVNSPLQEFIPEEKYDHIFSNPPYYDNSLQNPEERKAAARHTDSLPLPVLLEFAAANLAPSGRLSLVLPADVRARLLRDAASFGLHPFRILSIRTTPSKPLKRIIAEFSFERAELKEEILTLQDQKSYPLNKEGRTPEYLALTADFYL